MVDVNVVTTEADSREFLTVAEVARLLRCSVPTVRRRIADGQLPAVKLGEGRSAIRIGAAELEAWLYSAKEDPR